MREAGNSKALALFVNTSPEEANKAIMGMNGKTVVTKPLYVAIEQSKKEHGALLTKNYMERKAVRDGGNPIFNSQGSSNIK